MTDIDGHEPTIDVHSNSVPPRLLRAMGVVALLVAIPFLVATVFLFQRGIGSDGTGAIATGLIGSIFTFAAIAAMRAARTADRLRKSGTPPIGKQPSRLLKTLIFLIALIPLWCGFLYFWDGLILFDQEYLHWLPDDGPWRSGQTPFASNMWELLITGEIFFAIGVFLCWFVFRRR